MPPMNGTIDGILKLGRKDGIPMPFSISTAIFIIPYVIRKNIVNNGAIVLRSAESKHISTTIPVKIMEFLGSPFLLSFEKNFENGRTRSRPKAIRVLGPPTMLPNADESVAPSTPAIIRIRHLESSNIMV